MLTSFFVLPHMLKLVVTHTHTWAYRKSKSAEERISFIYILVKIRLKFGPSLNQRTWRYNIPAKSTYLRQNDQRTDILLSKDWLL